MTGEVLSALALLSILAASWAQTAQVASKSAPKFINFSSRDQMARALANRLSANPPVSSAPSAGYNPQEFAAAAVLSSLVSRNNVGKSDSDAPKHPRMSEGKRGRGRKRDRMSGRPRRRNNAKESKCEILLDALLTAANGSPKQQSGSRFGQLGFGNNFFASQGLSNTDLLLAQLQQGQLASNPVISQALVNNPNLITALASSPGLGGSSLAHSLGSPRVDHTDMPAFLVVPAPGLTGSSTMKLLKSLSRSGNNNFGSHGFGSHFGSNNNNFLHQLFASGVSGHNFGGSGFKGNNNFGQYGGSGGFGHGGSGFSHGGGGFGNSHNNNNYGGGGGGHGGGYNGGGNDYDDYDNDYDDYGNDYDDYDNDYDNDYDDNYNSGGYGGGGGGGYGGGNGGSYSEYSGNSGGHNDYDDYDDNDYDSYSSKPSYRSNAIRTLLEAKSDAAAAGENSAVDPRSRMLFQNSPSFTAATYSAEGSAESATQSPAEPMPKAVSASSSASPYSNLSPEHRQLLQAQLNNFRFSRANDISHRLTSADSSGSPGAVEQRHEGAKPSINRND